MGFLFGDNGHKQVMVSKHEALPGRDEKIEISGKHFVSGTDMFEPYPQNTEVAYFALGCFWGAERLFWQLNGVYTTAVGYQGGFTLNPTYEEVCSGRTGHAESVLVVFDPSVISYKELLKVFFEEHNPTQVMRQGNDVGTQYRSEIFPTTPKQFEEATQILETYNSELVKDGIGEIATQVHSVPAPDFYFAEEYHQQYLAKNPNGYCGLKGTGVSCAIN